MIYGNMTGKLQAKTITENEIGECVNDYSDVYVLRGYLDFSGGSSYRNKYNGKFEETTHIFMCDYQDIALRSNECRFMDDKGNIYEVLLIDDPMNLHQHLEILLKFVGVQ